jgi:hypothetical protein
MRQEMKKMEEREEEEGNGDEEAETGRELEDE